MKHKNLLLMLALAGAAAATQAQDIKADAAAGEKKAAMCIGCHGLQRYQASFPEVHKVPMISGQGAKYIAASLNAYKTGDRKHPTMRGIAGSLTDQDVADLAAFYESNGKPFAAAPEQPAAAHPDVAALLAKGACLSCHGANFSKPIDGSYPKIAGQYNDYLYVALKAYKTEGNPLVGRSNAIMGGMVKQFSLVELKAISNYIGSLPGELKTVSEPEFRWMKASTAP
jgi:cytochrome c553